MREQAGPQGVADLLDRAGLPFTQAELEDEDSWFGFDDKIALFEAAAEVLGDPHVARRIGESAVRQSAGSRQKVLFRALGGPRRLLLALPWVAPKISTALRIRARPAGPASVLVGYQVGAGHEPHRSDCDYNIGLLSQAGPLFGLPPLHVEHTQCQVNGAPECVYRVSWRPRSWWPTRLLRTRRASLRAQTASVTEQFESLQRASADLVSEDDLGTVLDRIALRAAGAVQGRRWVLVVRTDRSSEPQIRHEGLSPAEVGRLRAAVDSDGLDVADPSVMVVEVASASRVYGWLAVDCEEVGYLPAERRLLQVYARHAAAALDAAIALDEARRQGETARLLLELAHRLAVTRTRGEVAEVVSAAASDIVGADSAVVLVWDVASELLVPAGGHGLTGSLESLVDGLTVRPADSPGVARLVRDHEPRILTADSARNDFGRWLLEAADAQMLAVFPMVAHGTLAGVLAARWQSGPARPDPELGERLAGIAHQGASALESAELLERIRHQALHDPLTGLANRELFADRVERAVRRARRQQGSLGVLYLDLDRFKKVNDELGHERGNEVLRETARRLVAALREDDTVARMGGDEFTVLLPGADAAAGEKLASLVYEACREPHGRPGEEVVVTASIGVAVYPDHGLTGDALVRNADHAMYSVKQRGRNGYQVYDGSGSTRGATGLTLERELRAAIDQRLLDVVYQPIVDLRTGTVEGLEALVRWPREEGELAPDAFVPLAEEVGIVGWVDRLVLERACNDAAAWRAAGLPEVQMSVNLSAQTLKQPRLVDDVARVLEHASMAPSLLEVEITESVAVGDTAAERGALAGLEALGVSVAIDDFGTRHAALGRLRQMHLSTLKVDRSFVDEIADIDEPAPLVSAIVALGRNLGLRVVAEGVETEVQQSVLVRLGCPYAQGYLFARPVPAGDVPAMLTGAPFSVAQQLRHPEGQVE